MPTPLQALLVEDNEDDSLLLLAALRRDGYAPEHIRVQTADAMRAALATRAWDIVLCDYSMPSFDAPAALQVLKESGRDTPLIIVSGTVGEDAAVAVMRLGAADYLLKDRLGRVGQAVAHALEGARLRRETRETETALREAGRFAQSTLDALSAHMCVLDETGEILATNSAWRRFAEANTPVALRGQTAGNYLVVCDGATGPSAAEGAAFAAGIRAVIRGDRELFEMEYTCHAPAEPRWFLGRVTRFPGDGPVRIVVAHLDITARKQAELDLARERNLLRTLFDLLPDYVYLKDTECRFVACNKRCAENMGAASPDALIGRSDADFYPPEIAASFRDNELAVLAGTPRVNAEATLTRPDGTRRVLLTTKLPIRDGNGNIIGIVGHGRDITEAKLAEERLREQAALLDKAHDAIIVRDLDHRVRYWNKSAERVYGWTAAEVMGRQIHKLFYRDETAYGRAIAALMKTGGWAGEIVQHRKDGAAITVEASWTLLCDKQGRSESILAINTDITERKRLEAQFLRAQRLESIGTLAAGISHDLNNVLAPILMSVALLRSRHADADSQKLLGMLESNAQRGAQMVRQVLAFGRGGLEGERILVQPGHIAREIGQIVQDTFPKSVRFEPHLPHDLWPVIGDPTQLHQILLNLCVNARDAMPDGGRLQLRMENVVLDENYAGLNPGCAPGPHVLISVTDTGTGIDPAIRDKIFDPFFSTKPKDKGTGLGLSTVLALVKGHGGLVNLYSEPGKGTTFKLYLPATTTAAAAETVATAASGFPRGHGELILVADDEEPVRLVVQKMLERFGYRVLLAANGAEAVSRYALQRAEISVVITDMAMPVMDGPATILALRTINPDVRIIGSSGMDSADRHATAAAAGLVHFIAKPYGAEALLKILQTALARGIPRSPPTDG